MAHKIKDKIRGGLADKKTVDDIVKKFKVTLKKVNKELAMGKKVEGEHTNNPAMAKEIAMDHLMEIPDYYTRLEKLEKDGVRYWKGKGIKESTKGYIKRLVRENLTLSVTDETPDTVTYNIFDGDVKVGTVVVGPTNPTFGDYSLEIFVIFFKKDTNHLMVGSETVEELFEQYEDVNRIYIQPKKESVDFWSKMNAQRINDDYMVILRHH